MSQDVPGGFHGCFEVASGNFQRRFTGVSGGCWMICGASHDVSEVCQGISEGFNRFLLTYQVVSTGLQGSFRGFQSCTIQRDL